MAIQEYGYRFYARGTRRVKRDLDGISQSATASATAFGRANRSGRAFSGTLQNIAAGGSNANKTLALLRSTLVVFASAAIARRLFEQADALQLIQNRLRVVTGSQQELNAVQSELFALSQRTRTSFEANSNIFQRFARATANLNLNYRELLELTEAVNQAAIISGATGQESRAALIQFSQGLASGELRGQELRSVLEQAPRLAEPIGRATGMQAGELLSFARTASEEQIQETLGAEAVFEAIRADYENLQKEFDRVSVTIGQSFTRLGNTFQLFIGQISQASGAGQFIISIIDGIRTNLDKLFAALLAFGGITIFNLITGQLIRFSATLLTTAGAVAGPLTRAFVLLLTPVGIMRSLFMSIGGLAVSAIAPIAGIITAIISPVRTLTAGFYALRAAVLTNPLFFVGAAIVTSLIGLFVLFKDEIDAVIESFGGLNTIFNNVAAAISATVITLIDNFTKLPSVIGDIAIQAANNLVDGFESGINTVGSLLNKVLPEKFEFGQADFGGFDNPFEGSASGLAEDFVNNFNTEIDAFESGGVVGTLKDRLSDLISPLTDALSFPEFDESLLELQPDVNSPESKGQGIGTDFEEAESSARNLRNELDRMIQKALETVTALDPLRSATAEYADTQFDLTVALKNSLITQEQYNNLLQRSARDIIGIEDPAREYADRLRVIDEFAEKAGLSQEELSKATREARLEFLETQTSAGAGAERFFLGLAEKSRDAATAVEDALSTAFSEAEDAFVEFTKTGKFEFTDFINTITDQLIKLSLRETFGQLGGSKGGDGFFGEIFGGGGNLFGLGDLGFGGSTEEQLNGGISTSAGSGGGGGGFFDDIFGSIGGLFNDLPFFASGGSFDVGANTSLASFQGSRDNRLVAFRANDNERVTVSQKGEPVGGGQRITQNINISTPTPESFRQAEAQIASQASRQLRASNRR